jgi:hypothetical protein
VLGFHRSPDLVVLVVVRPFAPPVPGPTLDGDWVDALTARAWVGEIDGPGALLVRDR